MSDPLITGFALGILAILGLLLSFFGGYYAPIQDRFLEVNR